MMNHPNDTYDSSDPSQEGLLSSQATAGSNAIIKKAQGLSPTNSTESLEDTYFKMKEQALDTQLQLKSKQKKIEQLEQELKYMEGKWIQSNGFREAAIK
jgi:sensor histidine kinase YesM